ncbi:MAG: Sporulation transcription regulator WhiA [Firmicutes bacterium]|nr:Sporulation transcription regulator WhiA [Bacillota bacterium]
MTFTEAVKSELVRVIDEAACCRRAELVAIIRQHATLQLSRGGSLGLNIATQSPGVARLILRLVKEHQPEARVFIRRRSAFRKNRMYLIFCPHAAEVLMAVGLWDANNQRIHLTQLEPIVESGQAMDCCLRAYLRGAFIISGTITDPNRVSYHLEMVTESEAQAEYLCAVMERCQLVPRTIRRKELLVVYLKEGEQIVDFLNLAGAHSSLLRVEEARVRKSMRNQVNRLVNAETANLNKTMQASWRQADVIRYIDKTIGITSLPEPLQEAAALRTRYPEASLEELSLYFTPPLSKSAVNHRLRKLEAVAKNHGFRGGDEGK